MTNIKTMLLRYDISVTWKTKATPNDYFFMNSHTLLKLRDLLQKVLWSFRLLLISCIVIIKSTKICIFFNYWNFFYKKKLTHAKKKVFQLLKTKILLHRRLKTQLALKYKILKKLRNVEKHIYSISFSNLNLKSTGLVSKTLHWLGLNNIISWVKPYQRTKRIFATTKNKKKFRRGLYNMKLIKSLYIKNAYVFNKDFYVKNLNKVSTTITNSCNVSKERRILPFNIVDVRVGFQNNSDYYFAILRNLVSSTLLYNRMQNLEKAQSYILKQLYYKFSYPTGYDREDSIEYGSMLKIFEVNKPATTYFSEFLLLTLDYLRSTKYDELLELARAFVPSLVFFNVSLVRSNLIKVIKHYCSASNLRIHPSSDKVSSNFFVEKKTRKGSFKKGNNNKLSNQSRVIVKTLDNIKAPILKTKKSKKTKVSNIKYLIFSCRKKSILKTNFLFKSLFKHTSGLSVKYIQIIINHKKFVSFKRSQLLRCFLHLKAAQKKRYKKRKKQKFIKISSVKQVLKSSPLLSEVYLANIQKRQSSLEFLRVLFLSNAFTEVKALLLNRVHNFSINNPKSTRKFTSITTPILRELAYYNLINVPKSTSIGMKLRFNEMTKIKSFKNFFKVKPPVKNITSTYTYADILNIKRSLLGIALKRIIAPLLARNVVFYGRPLLRLKAAPYLLLYTWQVTVSLPRTYTARLFFYRDLSNIIICTTLLRCSSLLSFYLARLLEQIPRHSWFFHIFTRIMSVFKFYCTAPISLKVLIKGRVNKKLRKHSVCLLRTQVAMSQLTSSIDYSLTHSFTNASLLGIKVWVVSFSKAAFVKTFAQRYKTY